jgi:flagellar assembly protein FliH
MQLTRSAPLFLTVLKKGREPAEDKGDTIGVECMPSKVLTGKDALPVQPVSWRRVVAGGEAAVHGQIDSLLARIAQLEQEVAPREQQALAAGYRKGEAAGQQQAVARLDPVAEQLARAVSDLSQFRRKLRRDAEQDVVKLALAIGKRILHREMSLDPEAILGVVKAALEKLEGREVDRVRVNPANADIVRKHVERLGHGQRLEVVADARLDRGAVVFETARGNLDVSVDTQLEEIQRGLVDRLQQQP